MPARRYTIVVADRTTGVVRRITISARPVDRSGLRGCLAAGPDRRRRGLEGDGRTCRRSTPATRRSRSRTPAIAPPPNRWPARSTPSNPRSRTSAPSRRWIPSWPRRWTGCPRSSRRARWAGHGRAAPRSASADDYAKHPVRARNAGRHLRPAPHTAWRACSHDYSTSRRRSIGAMRWPPPRRRSGRSRAGSPRRWATGRIRSPAAPITIPVWTSPATGRTGLRHRGRHGQGSRLPERLRKSRHRRSRFRSADPLRPSPELLGEARAIRSSAAMSSAASAPPAAPPVTTSTTRCSPTAGSSTRSNSSPSRDRATSNLRHGVFTPVVPVRR